jgi:hypothetical protein
MAKSKKHAVFLSPMKETVLEAVLRWHQCMERGRDAGALLPLGERVGPLKVGKIASSDSNLGRKN